MLPCSRSKPNNPQSGRKKHAFDVKDGGNTPFGIFVKFYLIKGNIIQEDNFFATTVRASNPSITKISQFIIFGEETLFLLGIMKSINKA
jgi:hypothetical protein